MVKVELQYHRFKVTPSFPGTGWRGKSYVVPTVSDALQVVAHFTKQDDKAHKANKCPVCKEVAAEEKERQKKEAKKSGKVKGGVMASYTTAEYDAHRAKTLDAIKTLASLIDTFPGGFADRDNVRAELDLLEEQVDKAQPDEFDDDWQRS